MTTRLTLVLAEGAERIEMVAPLDSNGRFDVAAGGLDPDAWLAHRSMGDAPPVAGLLRHDADGGWSVRFSETAGDPDAPLTTLLPGDGAVGLGGFLSIREPDGRVQAWQVVSVG